MPTTVHTTHALTRLEYNMFSCFTQSITAGQDFSDEWQDLDDLLEDVLGAGDLPGITSTVEKSSVPADESQVNAKLSQVDALLVAQAECVAAGRRGEAGTTAGFEQAGIEATKSMEAFLGGGGEATNNGLASYRRPPDNVGLGDEEERLLQMVILQTDWLLRAVFVLFYHS